MESWANDKAAGTNFLGNFFLWAFYYPYLIIFMMLFLCSKTLSCHFAHELRFLIKSILPRIADHTTNGWNKKGSSMATLQGANIFRPLYVIV